MNRTYRPAITRPGQIATALLAASTFASGAPAQQAVTASAAQTAPPHHQILRQNCVGCHGNTKPAGGINLQKLMGSSSVGDNFHQWVKVVHVIEQKQMPPSPLPPLPNEKREVMLSHIKADLDTYARKHDGDPGKVTVRRLTSAEYAYTVQDLTGLELKADLSSDTVGGEGFTNFGDVQFMEESILERYLDSAKQIAAHAVVGAGPLTFFSDAGKSGFELAAVHRIQEIYRSNGFRSIAGEGARPYGLEIYGKGFYAVWRYQNRIALGQPRTTLAAEARREGVSPRFAQHLLKILQTPDATYPTSEVIERFRKLPSDPAKAKEGCVGIQNFVFDWPRWLFAAGAMAEGGRGDERAQLVNENSLKAAPSQPLRGLIRGKGQKQIKVYLSINPANPGASGEPVVIWRKPTVQIRNASREALPTRPLKAMLSPQTLARLTFDGDNLVTRGKGVVEIDLPLPDKALFISITTEAALAPESPADTVLRCTIADTLEPSMGTPVVALLAHTGSDAYKQWRAGVLEFARNLPQNSQGEPTPSDRDDIPPPFNNTYNQPERDWFHQRLKYYRTDDFLVRNILDDAGKAQLEEAWADLLTSFEYHDVFLGFVNEKFHLGLEDPDIAKLDVNQLPEEPRRYAAALQAEYRAAAAKRKAAETRHIADAIAFAEKAWRRPLTVSEKASLRAFYTKTRTSADHDRSIRALLTRVLVSPAFLYRVEAPPARLAGLQPLNNWQLANRLSYFLWSSPPDAELRRAAAAGELTHPENLAKQARRMLTDSKARRFASEFFGQWLGFYRFDEYRGVDTSRFPEFTPEVKQGMYEEAVSFFDHIVRNNRPVAEMYAADYTFLTQPLAKHYGYKSELKAGPDPVKVDGASAFHRGGMLRLGAVLTATSAPLRTSPVKRGDWMLRRVLGTPTPPPPPDAGSLPGDEKAFGGQTLRERLESHKRNPACASCHTRIDPMGFPLERYDAVGRWRDTYSDGQPIDDTAKAADVEVNGVDGLLKYLKNHDEQVMRNLSYKLVGYALGRTVLGSDQMLVNKLTDLGMKSSVADLAAEIAASRQFRYRKEDEGTN